MPTATFTTSTMMGNSLLPFPLGEFETVAILQSTALNLDIASIRGVDPSQGAQQNKPGQSIDIEHSTTIYTHGTVPLKTSTPVVVLGQATTASIPIWTGITERPQHMPDWHSHLRCRVRRSSNHRNEHEFRSCRNWRSYAVSWRA